MNENQTDSTNTAHDAPLDPAVERVRRKMMRLMLVSVAIMMIGLMAVIGAVFYKISNRGGKIDVEDSTTRQTNTPTPAKSTPWPVDGSADIETAVDLPNGYKLTHSQLNGERIVLTLSSTGGGRALWVFDLVAGRVIAKIAIKEKP